MGKSEGELGLKPCPFCGGSNLWDFGGAVGCKTCMPEDGTTRAQWNTRAEGLVAKSEVAELVKALQDCAHNLEHSPGCNIYEKTNHFNDGLCNCCVRRTAESLAHAREIAKGGK